jgi:hypothetical protein
MKQLTQTFNELQALNPNLSSFICFGRACKKLKPSKRNISEGFRKLVEKDDYEKRSYEKLLKHLENMA